MKVPSLNRRLLLSIALLTPASTSPASPSGGSAPGDPAATPATRQDVCFAENFDAYADQAAFEAAWKKDGKPTYQLDTTVGHDSKASVRLGEIRRDGPSGGGNSNRFYRDLPNPLTPADDSPVIFSYHLFLDPADAPTQWATAWHSLDIRGYSQGGYGKGDVTSVISIGLARASANPWSADFFQGRVYAPDNADIRKQYHTLNTAPNAPKRAAGWHTLTAEIRPSSTTYFVDGTLASTVKAGTAQPLTSIVLGTDVSSGGISVWCDNIVVRQPRPRKNNPRHRPAA